MQYLYDAMIEYEKVKRGFMALVNCPVCDKSISKRAHTCPGCGEPDPLKHVAKSTMMTWFIWVLILGVVGYVTWFYAIPTLVEVLRQR